MNDNWRKDYVEIGLQEDDKDRQERIISSLKTRIGILQSRLMKKKRQFRNRKTLNYNFNGKK